MGRTKSAAIECPQCGNKTFKLSAEKHAKGEFDGAVCIDCGRVISEDDIRAKAIDVAENEIRSMASRILGDVFKKRS
ncbi:ECs_2282 family putative zinc-binding protein [Azonexus sp. IMCC34839]|uniref:ECs_2282 family putative zinc-binding protein n=1 Tax=Azonexus sp. IMCC34839 TaxID=3133695 RepID=UPI00399ACD4B